MEHLIQFNDYHVHPVGRHTLATIARLSGFLRDDGWAGEIARRVKDPERLILAGFFHDLGKGEPNHSEAGAEIARKVLARYGRDKRTIEDVALLVRHHLLIPKVATRRDLSDERVASEVAGVAGNVERLDMLYLLSVADSMATGPRAWNSWTQALFAELYHKVRRLLEHGPLAEPDAAERLVRARSRVLKAARDLDPELVEAAIRAMPVRAFLALDAETLADHIRLVRRLWDAVAEDRMRKPSSVGGKGVNLVEGRAGQGQGDLPADHRRPGPHRAVRHHGRGHRPARHEHPGLRPVHLEGRHRRGRVHRGRAPGGPVRRGGLGAHLPVHRLRPGGASWTWPTGWRSGAARPCTRAAPDRASSPW